MRYRCKECEATFIEPDIAEVETGVKDETGFYRETVSVEICPECGCDCVESYAECLICEENEVEIGDYCEECLDDMESELVIALERFRKRYPEATDEDMWYMTEELATMNLAAINQRRD